MDLHLFKKEPFTEREAWLYLLENAAYQPIIREVCGMAVSLDRGQLIASYRYLAEAWGWKTKSGLAKDKVRSFIEKLQRHSWVATSTNYFAFSDSKPTTSVQRYDQRPTLITICDYNELQRYDPLYEDGELDSHDLESQTASRQVADKPNQYQNKNKEIKNKLVGSAKRDDYLFDKFPSVNGPRDFINYMPNEWQNYATQVKKWDSDKVIFEAEKFWIRYAGEDMRDRLKRHSFLEMRQHWHIVWQKWCDQDFRNTKEERLEQFRSTLK